MCSCVTGCQLNSSVYLCYRMPVEFKCVFVLQDVSCNKVCSCVTRCQLNSSVYLCYRMPVEFKCVFVLQDAS